MSQPRPAAGPSPKSWEQMRDWAVNLLRSRTGQDVPLIHGAKYGRLSDRAGGRSSA